MATYNKSSPYYDSQKYGFFLDVWAPRDLPKNSSDVVYRIQDIYKFRPDLLAFDLYGDTSLWWVFAVRNPNTLEDPVFDFLPGTTIYIPKKDVIKASLGL
jgi:hypothetical protein